MIRYAVFCLPCLPLIAGLVAFLAGCPDSTPQGQSVGWQFGSVSLFNWFGWWGKTYQVWKGGKYQVVLRHYGIGLFRVWRYLVRKP